MFKRSNYLITEKLKEEDIEERIFIDVYDEINFRLNWLSEDIFFLNIRIDQMKNNGILIQKIFLKFFIVELLLNIEKPREENTRNWKENFLSTVLAIEIDLRLNHNNPIFLNIPI